MTAKTTQAPNAEGAALGTLGIGSPRLPTLDYFPGETISEYVARHGVKARNRVQVAGWLNHEEPLA